MTSQIEQQRGDLIDANKELDTRRRLTDAVLAGVSAGVLSVDSAGIITRTNRSALELLALPEDGVVERPLIAVMPELAPLVEQAARAARPGHAGPGRDRCRAARGASCWCASVRRRMPARSSPSTTSPT